jgi:hypothetical protein
MNIATLLRLKEVENKVVSNVINKLYDSIDYTNTYYYMVRTQKNIDNIKKFKPYISVHFQGIAYIIFYTEINDKPCTVLISKRELKKTKTMVEINKVRMYYMPFCHPNGAYHTQGTVIDGKLVHTEDRSVISFIIHELYFYDYMKTDLADKYEIIRNEFLEQLNKKSGTIEFKTAKLYEFNELPDLLFDKIPKANYNIQGLMFLNRISRPYHVYENKTEFYNLKTKKKMPLTKIYHKSINQFLMIKTDKPDVYKLNDMKDNYDCGIAYIPNTETSHYFYDLMKDKKQVRVNCIKSVKYNKWIPLCDDKFDYLHPNTL